MEDINRRLSLPCGAHKKLRHMSHGKTALTKPVNGCLSGTSSPQGTSARHHSPTRRSGEDKPVVTKDDILNGLREVGIRAGDSLFVHSSLSRFGRVDGGSEAVCDAIVEVAGPEGIAALPTFTWGAYHNKLGVRFDVRNDACVGMGAIPETFRQRDGVVRDEHVCHSIAATGRRAHQVLGDGVRPFAWGSGMYRLYEMDFWYVFLGCGFGSCTALHTVEELVQVPYRYYRHFKGSTVLRADGQEAPAKSVEFLRREPYLNDFAGKQADFEREGLVRTTRVGNATLKCLKTRDIVDYGVARMREDMGYLLDDASKQYLADDDGAPPAP